MRRFLPLLTLPVLLAPAGALLAAAVEPELAIAPSRLPQRLDESPSAVTVIDREMLREAGVRRIADILRLVPGMVVGSRSPAIQPATYLGLSDDYSRRVQVLVDGISIYAPSTGAVLWQDLPLAVEDIERIEVVRGPNTAAYGSHALLATIKITTVAPREASRWGAGGAIGSNGVRDAHARLAGSGSAGAWMLSVVHQQDDGLDGRAADDRGGRRLDGVRLKGELDLSPATDMQWQLGAARARNGIGAALEQDVSGTINDAFLDENDHQFLALHHHPGGGGEWVLRLARNAQRYKEADALRYDWVYRLVDGVPSAGLEPLSLTRSYRATRYEAELEHHLVPLGAVRGVWGLGLRREEAEGERFFGTPASQRLDSGRLFGHAEWRIAPNWLLNGGAMVERTSISEPVFTPRLALIHHLAPGHTLRAGWSTGTRQPLLFENQGRTAAWDRDGHPVWLTLASGAASGGLKAERATEWSLGYLWVPRRGMQLDLRAFHLRLKDPIRALMRVESGMNTLLYPIGGDWLPLVLDMRNGGAVSVRGLEALLDTRLSRDLSLHLSYALTEAREDEDLEPGWPDYAATVPRHTAGLLLTQRLGEGWDASLRLHYTSPMQWGFLTRDALDASTGLAARIGYVRRFGAQRMRIDLIGENLNGRVHDFDRERGWDRAVWLRLALDAS